MSHKIVLKIGIAVVLRLDIWSRALAMMRDMPFTGIGLNTFSLIQWNFYPGHLLGPEPHAHNIYMQTALDMGLPGLAAFAWFFIAWGVRVWRNIKNGASGEYRALLAGIAAGIAAYLTAGWMDAMMMGAKPSVLVWGLMGMAGAPGYTKVQEQPGVELAKLPKTRWLLRTLPLLGLMGMGLTGVLVKPESLLLNLGAVQAQRRGDVTDLQRWVSRSYFSILYLQNVRVHAMMRSNLGEAERYRTHAVR